MATKKTELIFDSISSYSASTLDLGIDFTGALETSETLSSVSVVSVDTGVLTVSNDAVNTFEIAIADGGTMAIGKGCTFQVTTVKTVTCNAYLRITITGNSGTLLVYEAIIPVTDQKREKL